VCAFFIGVRFGWLGPHLREQSLGLFVDKWQIGPLRVLNIAAFMVLFYWLRKYVKMVVAREPFLTLGKASLQVFCAHLFFVFAGLALLYGEMEQLHGMTAVGLLIVTFVCLFLVAANEVRKRRAQKKAKLEAETSANVSTPPGTATLMIGGVEALQQPAEIGQS
jgi:fucose 4-O-acetylase-like acetyltransferase